VSGAVRVDVRVGAGVVGIVDLQFSALVREFTD
jgi:hypothetical protein